nr:MAG TPA: hypothetical protein [Caudoviricetes sp.]
MIFLKFPMLSITYTYPIISIIICMTYSFLNFNYDNSGIIIYLAASQFICI